jgi:hypothetical protein
MVALTAAVVLVGTLCILDMLMTFGVVRRLREYGARLDELAPPRDAAAGRAIAGELPPPDHTVGDFVATTTDGRSISPGVLPAGYVAVFLAADCVSCRQRVPRIRKWAATQDRDRVLVLIDGQASDPADLVSVLEPVANVVVEAIGTPTTEAFAVTTFPSFCVVGDGKVVLASMDFGQLPATAVA